MKIKKFTAVTMAEAHEKIRGELGDGAVILHSKETASGGFFGLFQKKAIEVIAAIDPETERHGARKTRKKQEKESRAEQVTHGNNGNQDRILKELSELKTMVNRMKRKDSEEILPDPVLSTLKEQGIDDDIYTQIEETVNNSEDKRKSDFEARLAAVKDALMSVMPKNEKDLLTKKYINVIGPTGVGKTTTLAKLAAHYSMGKSVKMAFITTDTYRIAAIEQLKTYASILNIPMEVAYNAQDFNLACQRFSHYDIVFIDTAGRNFRNSRYVEELQTILSFEEEVESYLVLSLTSKQQDMDAVVQQFSTVPLTGFIFTKIDETTSYGSIVNMTAKYGIPPAFLTNGQDVPDDLLPADKEVIADHILGGCK